MLRKFLFILLPVVLLFTGCQNSRQIETASIIENVSVDRGADGVVYTFYLLGDGEKPTGVSVPASSFEEACALAQRSYIPNLSLAKLELLMLSESVYAEVMQEDVAYIATQPSFSPIAYVTLCDSGAVKAVEKDAAAQRMIEKQLVLLKKNNPAVCIDYLSIFNHYAQNSADGFSVPLIHSDKELKVGEMHIYSKNISK